MAIMTLGVGLSWGRNIDAKQIHRCKTAVKNYKYQCANNNNIAKKLPILLPKQIETQQVIHGFEKQKEKFSTDTKGGIKILNKNDNNMIMP